MSRYLRKTFEFNADTLTGYDAAVVKRARSMSELDACTFAVYGYEDVEEWWASNDFRDGLADIAVPFVGE
jgi:predicted alpha/beta-fold hydrolase